MPFNQSLPPFPHFAIPINYHNIIVKMDTVATHILWLNIMYDLHNVINLSVDVSHVLVLSSTW